jgi:hypothetical protein
MQTWAGRHAAPHEPQLLGSVVTSTQAPEQRLTGHEQAPSAHTAPAGQSFEQSPQFLASVWVSTHSAPHSVVFHGQLHEPLEHS